MQRILSMGVRFSSIGVHFVINLVFVSEQHHLPKDTLLINSLLYSESYDNNV